MAKSKQSHSSATFKGLVMLAVALGVPFVLATQTSLPERIDRFLVEQRVLHSDDYAWGGGDAPGWSHGNPSGVPVDGSAVIPAEYIEGSGFGVSQSPALPAGSGDRFTAIESRLRELGAVYYVLETRSLDPPKFRFLCRTALAGNQNVQQKFEATDTDPLAAMRQVLRQVEQWHHGW